MNLPFFRLRVGLGFLLALAALLMPARSGAVLRDGDFIRENAPPYVAQAQEEAERYERDLRRGRGERPILLLRLSRVYCTLGELTEDDRRLACYEKGKHYAELLLEEKPGWVKGRYWLALNLCGVAEVGGAGRALGLLPELVELLEKVASQDPAYDQAGAHRALGSIYAEAPAWPLSVGDLHKSWQHLARAVQIAPENSTNRLFLGYTLLQLGKIDEARKELARVFTASQHSFWPLGVEHDRREARRLLAKFAPEKRQGRQSKAA